MITYDKNRGTWPVYSQASTTFHNLSRGPPMPVLRPIEWGSSVCAIPLVLLTSIALHAAEGPIANGDPASRIFSGNGVATWQATAAPAWRLPMRHPARATPIIVGDAVYTLDEPGTLICVDAADGTERWRREVTAAALLADDEAKELRTLLASVTASWARGEDEGSAPAEVQKHREALWKDHGIAAIYQDRYRDYGYAGTDPLSDGEQIYVVNGTCVASAFDQSGKRRWMVRFTDRGKQKPTIRASQSVLIGDRLIIKVWPKGRTRNAAVSQLLALSTADGSELWRSAEFACADHGEWGGQAIATVGDRQLVVTPGGRVFDPADGRELINGLGNCSYGMSPATAGDVVVFSKSCVRLGFDSDGTLQASPALQVKSFGHTPIIAHGRGYVVSPKGVHCFAIDQLDGGKPAHHNWQAPGAWPRKLRLRSCTPSAVGDAGLMAFDATRLAAWTLGDKPKLLWVQELPTLNTCSAPVSDGERLILRLRDALVAWKL